MTSKGFGAVARFEITRTFRKPQFWIAALLLPVLFGVIAATVAWSSKAATDPTSGDVISFEYSAPSGLISPRVAAEHHGAVNPDPASGISAVKKGSLEAFLEFGGTSPAFDVTIYAQDKGVFSNGSYEKLARSLFAESLDSRIGSVQVVEELRAGVTTHMLPFKNGEPAPGLGAMLPPSVLVVVLVLVIALLGNQILNVTTEERETRISEILLVGVTGRTLIQAKLFALAVVGLVQVCVISIPSLVLLAVSDLPRSVGELGLEAVVFDPARMAMGVLVLICGLVFMTSVLVLIGAMMPSAKDAAPYCSVAIVATIAPLYLVTSIIVDPTSTVATVMTFVPFFAAATALLRNAAGGLSLWEAVVVAVELCTLTALLLRFAVAVFERGGFQRGARMPGRGSHKLAFHSERGKFRPRKEEMD